MKPVGVSEGTPPGFTGGSVMTGQESRILAGKIAFGGTVDFIRGTPDFTEYDAILSVGTIARPDLPWTVINSNGWLARVSSGSSCLPTASGLANPVGALAAACLGVAEVFKRLIRLKESRGRLLDGLTFSLHSYRCMEVDPGPQHTISRPENPGGWIVQRPLWPDRDSDVSTGQSLGHSPSVPRPSR